MYIYIYITYILYKIYPTYNNDFPPPVNVRRRSKSTPQQQNGMSDDGISSKSSPPNRSADRRI